MTRIAAALVILLLASPRSALADADEFSVHVQLPVGHALITDPNIEDQQFAAMVLGASVRASYAVRNWYAYEVNLSWERLNRTIDGLADPETNTHLWRSVNWVRGEVGVTTRLGVVWIPVFHASVGGQLRLGKTWTRQRWSSKQDMGMWFEPLITLGAGLDHRFNKNWVAGVMSVLRQSVLSESTQYRAWGATVHVSYYMYM